MKQIKNTIYIKFLLLAAVLFSSAQLSAQDEEATSWTDGFSLSGSVDAYYRANLNGLNKVMLDENGDAIAFPSAPGSSFANDTGFAIGMANAILSYEHGNVGAVADLVFGPRGEDAVFNSFGSPAIVNQLYVYWNVSESVTLTFGNFNTFLGYEVISPVANFNYSTSYMFSYGPFSHTGLKADFALSDDVSLMLAVMNPTDWTEFDPFGSPSFGAQLGYAGQFLNLLYGKQGFTEFFDTTTGEFVDTDAKALFQIDYTGGFDLSEDFFLGINATYQDTDGTGFYGVALYPQYQTSENFAIGLRGEYFSEMENYGAIGAVAPDASVIAVTLTGSATVGDHLIIKPEIRFDSASEDSVYFVDGDLEIGDSLASFVLAAVYSF
ncbi:porin [Robiginitalea biformata]|uniref:porin n=1 Tax=Robiginitalea biformata TaxID=252307 RepID=UPI003B5CD7E1